MTIHPPTAEDKIRLIGVKQIFKNLPYRGRFLTCVKYYILYN